MDIAGIAQSRYTTKAFDPSRTIPAPLMAQLRTVLRFSPSSVNSQPWHFVVAASSEAKGRIARAMQGPYAYNEPKVLNASHVVVLCGKTALDDAHLAAIIAQENHDGRFPAPEHMATQDKSRRFYVNLHRDEWQDERTWIERQVYLALGTLLLAAGALGVDACTMEGFDVDALDAELGLSRRGLRPLVVVALGYRAADDFNAGLPKSRLPEESVFTEL
jgi:nitroreductase/dihydropteridine reductase